MFIDKIMFYLFILMLVIFVIGVFWILAKNKEEIERISEEKNLMQSILDKNRQEMSRYQQEIASYQKQIISYAEYAKNEKKGDVLVNITCEYMKQIEEYKKNIENLENKFYTIKHEYDILFKHYTHVSGQLEYEQQRQTHV